MSGGAEPVEAGRPLHWRARLAASGSGRYLALGFFAAFLSLDAGDHGEKNSRRMTARLGPSCALRRGHARPRPGCSALAMVARRNPPARSAATRACQNTPVAGRARTRREGVGGNQRPRCRVQADLVERVGRRSGHLLLAEGRATGNYRMYDHSVAQAATD